MVDINNISYAFTVRGGGWGTLNELFVIMKDGTVLYSKHFFGDISNIKNLEAEDVYKLDSELSNFDFENFKSYKYVVMDAPDYTMYKFIGGEMVKLFTSTHEDCCDSMKQVIQLRYRRKA